MPDILIRGMEMPPKGKYNLTLYVLSNGETFIKVNGEYFAVDAMKATVIVPAEKGETQ